MREYLDKNKFLSKFSCFDGFMQYIDSDQKESCQGIVLEEFKQELNQDEDTDDQESMRDEFFNNYQIEEKLVSNVNCGGYTKQPICIYDFTVKTLSHDCLNYSTRHMSIEGKENFII